MNNSCMKNTFSQTKGFHEKRGIVLHALRSLAGGKAVGCHDQLPRPAATTGCSWMGDVSRRSGAARIGVWKRKGSFTDMAGGWGHPYRGPRPRRLAAVWTQLASAPRAVCVGRPSGAWGLLARFCNTGRWACGARRSESGLSSVLTARPTPAETRSRRSPGPPSAAEPFRGQLVSLVASEAALSF